MISLPSNLLAEVDGLVSVEKKNRSEFIREAMKLYLAEKKRRNLREEMKQGYQSMAELNLLLAREGSQLEEEAAQFYQDRLVECR
jgi:CopG family transcriptional regulator/antitoxin EndoAI